MPVLIACITAAALLFQITDPPPRVERLSNGLRVVVVPDRTQPLISVQLWYAVGSAFDDPSNPGLCHIARTILERRNDAAPRLRAAGVRFESRTLRDACYFSSVLPPDSLEQVLKIEAERMQPLSATPEMLASALAAALTPDRLDTDRQLLAAMFPQHAYAHPPGFVAESLARLSPDDVDTFLQRWFVPRQRHLAHHRRRKRRDGDGPRSQALRPVSLGRVAPPSRSAGPGKLSNFTSRRRPRTAPAWKSPGSRRPPAISRTPPSTSWRIGCATPWTARSTSVWRSWAAPHPAGTAAPGANTAS